MGLLSRGESGPASPEWLPSISPSHVSALPEGTGSRSMPQGGSTTMSKDRRKQGMEAIEAAFLAAIVDSSDDAIVSKDLNGIVTSWNKSAERIFGYPAEEMIGQPITVLVPPDRPDEEPRIL